MRLLLSLSLCGMAGAAVVQERRLQTLKAEAGKQNFVTDVYMDQDRLIVLKHSLIFMGDGTVRWKP